MKNEIPNPVEATLLISTVHTMSASMKKCILQKHYFKLSKFFCLFGKLSSSVNVNKDGILKWNRS